MKNICIIFLISNLAVAQHKKFRETAISLETGYAINMGDNFLNNGYTNANNVGIEIQQTFGKFLFGYQFNHGFYDLKNKEIIGKFDDMEFYSTNFFVGFRQNLTNRKYYLEHYIGSSDIVLQHHSKLSNYNLSGSGFFVGSVFNIKFKSINAFGGLNIDWNHYNTALNGPYKEFYSKSIQITPKFGLKYTFRFKSGKEKYYDTKTKSKNPK